MITKDTLPKLLTALGFTKQGAIYRKTIAAAVFKVDTAKGEISYPDGVVVNGEFTCNFSSPENFVVLECVHRLIAKGYKPEHIELEPKWKLGHGASGGRADILVKDNIGAALLLIECKTAGSEFTKAWKKTLNDGDQLFSYAQQISETQFLCLYASDFEDNTPTYTSHIIAHRDNEKYLADNPLAKSFKSVSDVKARYAVWHDTYKLDYTTKGIFEDSIQPYHIGKDKYSLDDLQAVSDSDQQKKYHEFATILRQHNVSGRENAFDKLVNLFLCKLVDETENPNELKFYWKGVAYDTHFELLDRLQQLYQAGMGKFLGEQITYINQNDVNNALRFIRQNPDATQRAVWNLFIQQKFFTNNDFSFIDVHNEKLFYQNAEVLLKILQMWQDIRLTNPTGHNQFLGDMFEGFLDQGVKQSEGQYFTPMPICRFILMSLPLENLISQHATPPKAIDYACGAGHFLNELATQIKPLVARHKQADLTDYHKAIFGIEKEYRLSKVAKVSAFMYGQQNINICYGDALVNQHPAFAEIQDSSFDLLVANPPYSVRGFLSTLPDEERKAYSLTDTLNDFDTANSIETFFIERAKQLLKSGGVAALILPSSILSNGGNTYVKTREILLQYFDIVAIAEFGSGTFGKTGTNTVTLFLRRKPTAPDTAEHYRERVAYWFNPENVGRDSSRLVGLKPDLQEPYQDSHFIAQYAAHIGSTLADYQTLLAGQPNDALLAHDTFAQYRKSFDASNEIVKLKVQKNFKAKSAAEQTAELAQRFLVFVSDIERDKLYHFVMASDQPNRVLVIRSPNDTKAQKQFLGYEWSSAKGNEGIKLVKNADGHHLTLLYDETNRDNADKLNDLIAANFQTVRGEPVEPCPSTSSGRTDGGIPPALSEYASLTRLVDMLDFSRVTFEKQIVLTAKKSVLLLSSRYPMEKLANLNVMLRRGKSAKYGTSTIQIIKSGQARGYFEFDFSEKHFVENGFILDERKLQKGDLLINSTGKGTAGRVTYFDLSGDFVADSHVSIFRANERLNPKFALYSLARIGFKEIESLADGASGQIELTLGTIGEIQIPLPPLEIQQQIVAECEAVDAEVETAQARISASHDLMRQKLGELSNAHWQPLGQVAHKVSDSVDPQLGSGMAFYIGLENIEGGSGQLVGETTTLYQDIKSTKICFQAGDVLYGKLRPNLNKVYLTQQAGICSTDILAFRFESLVHARFYAAFLRTDTFNREVLKGVSGQQLPRTSWGNMQTIKVPVLDEQALNNLVADIQALENTIAQAQAIIAAAPAKKQAIMQRYL
jgi:type I restriction-modification system DNA methylase subunit/restriction endonuclease S subunit